MLKRMLVVLSVVLGLSALPLFSQTVPCPSGSLANVLGTSCAVGSVIFNFQTRFLAGATVGNTSHQITPADIGFIPIQSGNQAGFRLVLGFADGPVVDGSVGSFNGHIIQFSYTPQAADGSEIRVQNLTMDASAQGAPQSSAFVQILDFQEYVNSGFVATDTAIDNENGASVFNQLSDNHILEVPGFFSTGSGFADAATTQISDFSTGTASDSLSSATFLYTSGPVIPTPSLAPLNYTNIDLDGAASTFVSNITNSGKTVGTYQDFAGIFHGYVADPQGNFVTIDVPGATGTFAADVNEKGDVTGSFRGTDRHTHGFVQRDGIISTFNVPGSRFTAAVGMNNQGQIVGEYESADRGFHGFVLDSETGLFTTIDRGPGVGLFASSAAFAINNSSEIGGTFFDPDTFRAYLLKNGSFRDLDVPGQGDATIEGLNDRGDAVGIYNDVNLLQHGFVLSHGNFQTVDLPGESNTFALGINASGAIVGQYSAPDGSSHSFLATPVPGDGQDHPPATSAQHQSQTRPDCSDESWHNQRDQLRNASSCQMKH